MAGVTDLSKVKYAVSGDHRPGLRAPLCGRAAGDPPGHGVQAPGGRPAHSGGQRRRVLSQNLRARRLSRGWLEGELRQRGIPDVRQVFLMTVDEKDTVYLARKERTP